jgi:hypothetical protein
LYIRRVGTARRFGITLLVAAAALAVIGAIVGGLSGRDVWRSVMWALAIGGGVLVVVNVAGSGSNRTITDPRTGFGVTASVQDATTSARWLFVGLILAGLGIAGLVV